MNADSRVMRYFRRPLTVAESTEFVRRIEEHFERYGYGLFAVIERATGSFVGFVGFQNATFAASFTPCTEIGWRLDYPFWGKGYATEAARACLHLAFEELGLDDICSFTSAINVPSIRVMERIGLKFRMRFLHPKIERDHELCGHVLYGIGREGYAQGGNGP